MKSVNKVVLMGYLAADPEKKSTLTGKSVVNFKLATNRDWKSSNGEKRQTTDYHRIVAWQKLAEVCAEYLKKGSGIYLEGRIMNKHFTDKEGKERTMTEILADTINFVTYSKGKSAEEVNLIEVPAL